MAQPSRQPADYFHLFVIYIVWASGYLGMKLGMSGPDPLTAYQLQGGRLVLGGLVLGLIARFQGTLRMPDRDELVICLVSAFLFWICGNGFALLALRDLPSGFVAMGMGTIPLWSAAYNAIRTRRRPERPFALVIGFIGLVLIYLPTMSNGAQLHASPFSLLALFLAPIFWVIATSLQPTLQRSLNGTVAASTQLIMGGLMSAGFALFQATPLPSPPGTQSLLAALYLALIASALSFQSYMRATALFPANTVAAFAYVNPIVGVLLGWAVLSEEPVPVSFAGMVIVILSVVLSITKRIP